MNARREVARRMSEAAAALLDSLDAEQRGTRRLAVPGRRRTPALVLHAHRPRRPAAVGHAAGAATPRDAARRAPACHGAGYVTVSTIIGLENVLDELEGFVVGVRSASGAATRGSTTCACSAFPTSTARGRGGSGGTTSRSTTPSSTARWSVRHRASSAPTRHRRRCSARTCYGRSPVPRTSAGSSSVRSTTHSAPPRSCHPVAPVRPRHRESGPRVRGRPAASAHRHLATPLRR